MTLFFKQITKTSILTSLLFTSTYSPCMLNNIAKTRNIIHNRHKHLSSIPYSRPTNQLHDYNPLTKTQAITKILALENAHIDSVATPSENASLLEGLMGIFSEMPTTVSLETKVNIKNLLLRLVKKHAYITQKAEMRLSIANTFVNQLTTNDFKTKNIDISEIIQIAKDSTYLCSKREILNLFKILITNNQGILEAAKTAHRCMLRDFEKQVGIDLFILLTGGDQAFTHAIYTASKGVNGSYTNDYCIGIAIVELFEVFVKKGQHYTEALQVADTHWWGSHNYHYHSYNTNRYIQKSVLGLLKALAEQDQGFPQAIEFAKRAIECPNTYGYLIEPALGLYKVLVNKNQAFTEAIYAAQECTCSERERYNSINIKISGLNLFKTLVEKNQAFSEATLAAQKNILHEDIAIRQSALHLFEALFQKNQGFTEAIQITQEGILNQNHTARKTFDLFNLLRKSKKYNVPETEICHPYMLGLKVIFKKIAHTLGL